MSHPAQRRFFERVRDQFPARFENCRRALDIGSLDINGNNRWLFGDWTQVTGIDLADGPNVDFVAHAHLWKQQGYDIVISSEALEHDEHWRQTCWHMANRLVRPGGLLVITCAGIGRPEHGTRRSEPYSSPFTLDYYQNRTESDLVDAFPISAFETSEFEARDGDLRFWGVRAFPVSCVCGDVKQERPQ